MTHLDDLLREATDPTAYDSIHTDWVIENGRDSSRQNIYREYFLPYKSDWLEKNVLDVGSGAGWLLNFFIQNGARSVLGLESSQKNVTASRELYPNAEVIKIDFMNIELNQQFDLITAVMVVTNLLDLEAAFSKFKSLMGENSKLILVVPDYDYFKTPRHDYGLDIEIMNQKEYVIEVKRPTVVLTDIVRKNEVYVDKADQTGLRCVDSIPMLPPSSFTEHLPQYEPFKSQPIMHLLRFIMNTKKF